MLNSDEMDINLIINVHNMGEPKLSTKVFAKIIVEVSFNKWNFFKIKLIILFIIINLIKCIIQLKYQRQILTFGRPNFFLNY